MACKQLTGGNAASFGESMNQRSYLDYNATAPLRDEVRAAMIDALSLTGNPSSVHEEGRRARAAVEAARAKVAALVGARSEDVIFTSSGTEANALALAQGGDGVRRFVSEIEHPSVLAAVPDATRIPVTSDGVIDLAKLETALQHHHLKGRRPFVSLMVANNETGAVQPVAETAKIVKYACVEDTGGLVHTDAVQAAGRMRLDILALGADLLSLSAHKIGGPKGVGALVLREGTAIEPLIKGGGQERRRRAGTENVPGLVGFGVAAELASADLAELDKIASLRDELEAKVRALAPDAVVLSAGVERLANTSCIAVPGAKAETLVIGLDLAGVAVSSGSACSSGKVEASHVLAAMGMAPEITQGAIRISLGFGSKRDDIENFLRAFGELIERLKTSRRAAA